MMAGKQSDCPGCRFTLANKPRSPMERKKEHQRTLLMRAAALKPVLDTRKI